MASPLLLTNARKGDIMPTEDRNGNLHSNSNGQFVEKGANDVDDAFDKRGTGAKSGSIRVGEGQPAEWEGGKTLGEKAAKTIKRVESDIRYLDYEKGIIVSKDGAIIFERDGAASEVVVSSELLEDAIFTHNHPHGLVFSNDDIKGFIEGRLYQLRATTPDDKTYILTRAKDFVKPSLYSDYKKIGRRGSPQEWEVQRKYEEYIGFYNSYLALNLALSEVREAWLKENSEKYNVKFEVEYG